MADSEEFFTTSEMTARLDLVRHLIENSELVPLVRGPAGIGKSFMASRLQQLAPDNWVVCHFAADSMMQPERLLSHIARCNGLPDVPGENLTRIEDRYAQLRKRGSTPVLLVDDAQALPPTSLITLLRLYERQIGGAPLVSLVLFANEQIDMLLSTPQLQVMTPQAIQVIDLPPLTREEASGFMRYLLNAEGLGDRFFLDEAKLNRIYRETAGIPGAMASAVLAAVGEDEESPKTSVRSIKKPLLLFGIPLLALILVLLVFQKNINRLFEPPQDKRSVVMDEATQLPDQVERRTLAEGEAGVTVNQVSAPPPLSETAPVSSVEPVAKTPSVVVQRPNPQPDNQISEENTQTLASQVGTAELEASGTVGVAEPLGVEEAVVAPNEEIPTPLPARAETGGVAVTEQPAAITQEPPKTIGKEPPAHPPAPAIDTALQTGVEKQATGVDDLEKTSDWLAAQSQGSYTIQLLAVENIESIRPVIARHGIAEKAFTIESRRNGKPWYPLLWGVFPDRPAALAALKQLPPSLQKGGAWVRPLESLRQ